MMMDLLIYLIITLVSIFIGIFLGKNLAKLKLGRDKLEILVFKPGQIYMH